MIGQYFANGGQMADRRTVDKCQNIIRLKVSFGRIKKRQYEMLLLLVVVVFTWYKKKINSKKYNFSFPYITVV